MVETDGWKKVSLRKIFCLHLKRQEHARWKRFSISLTFFSKEREEEQENE